MVVNDFYVLIVPSLGLKKYVSVHTFFPPKDHLCTFSILRRDNGIFNIVQNCSWYPHTNVNPRTDQVTSEQYVPQGPSLGLVDK